MIQLGHPSYVQITTLHLAETVQHSHLPWEEWLKDGLLNKIIFFYQKISKIYKRGTRDCLYALLLSFGQVQENSHKQGFKMNTSLNNCGAATQNNKKYMNFYLKNVKATYWIRWISFTSKAVTKT